MSDKYTIVIRRITGIILFIGSFFWGSYLDEHWMGFSLDSNLLFLEPVVILLPLMISLGFLLWDTKFIQEGF